MKKNDAVKLEEYRREVEKAKAELSEFRGERKALETRVKEDYKLKPDEIDGRLELIEADLESKEEEFTGLMEKLEKAFEYED